MTGKRKENMSLSRFCEAHLQIQRLGGKLRDGSESTEQDMENGLRELFQAIKECCAELENRTLDLSDSQAKLIRRNVLDTWDDLASDHLPVSLALLRKRYRSSATAAGGKSHASILASTPPPAADAGKSPALLLMAGYSVEQLVLCIALNYYQHGVRYVVPFAGKTPNGGNSWRRNEILKGLQAVGILVGTVEDAEVDEDVLCIAAAKPVNASSPARVFQEILKWSREKENQNWGCRLDVTGGQKPMDSGGSYAAMYLGWPAYYLDFSVYDEKLRRPEPQSLRYEKLLLPSVAFSLDSRKAIAELAEGLQFSRALEHVEKLKSFVEISSFFEEEDGKQDVKCIDEARRLIERSLAWLRADYFHRSLDDSDDPFCKLLRSAKPEANGIASSGEGAGVDPANLRDLFRRFLVAGAESGGRSLLVDYAVNEYWRVRSLFDAHHDARDCLIGTHGLQELLVDGLLNLTNYQLKIAQLVGVVVYPNEGQPPYALDAERVRTLLCNAVIPFVRLPPAAGGEKRKLVLIGKCKFELRIPIPAGAEYNSHDDLYASLGDWFGAQADAGSDNFIECDVLATLSAGDSPIVRDEENAKKRLSNKRREQRWGEYKWSEFRNLTAHWRVPLGPEFNGIVSNALDIWLPRYIGLYSLATQATSQGLQFTDEDCFEEGRKLIGTGQCRPWHNSLANDDSRISRPQA